MILGFLKTIIVIFSIGFFVMNYFLLKTKEVHKVALYKWANIATAIILSVLAVCLVVADIGG